MFGKIKKYTESELIKLLKQDCEPALRELYERYESRIFNYTYRFLQSHDISAEITQDVFIKLWEYRAQLNEQLEIAPWLFKVTKNGVLNHIRSASRQSNLKKEYALSIDHSFNNVEENIHLEECRKLASRAVDLLPAQCKSIFTLSRTDGKSYDEIAALLGISRNTVRIQIIKSLKSIRQYMAVNME